MAADSSCWVGQSEIAKVKKIFRIKKGLVGCAGNISAITRFIKWLKDGAIEEEYPVGDFEALVVDPLDRITMWEGDDHSPIRVKGYCAIGSGADFALGALFAGASAPTAARAAVRHHAQCRAPVSVYKL